MTWMEHKSTIRRARRVVLAQLPRATTRPATVECVERHIPVPRHGALQPDGQQIAANARMVAQGLEAPIQRVMGLPTAAQDRARGLDRWRSPRAAAEFCPIRRRVTSKVSMPRSRATTRAFQKSLSVASGVSKAATRWCRCDCPRISRHTAWNASRPLMFHPGGSTSQRSSAPTKVANRRYRTVIRK
jgi:hypothetical protein